MNTKEFKANLIRLGMTQKDLSQLLDVTERTVNVAINSDKIKPIWIYALRGIMYEKGLS